MRIDFESRRKWRFNWIVKVCRRRHLHFNDGDIFPQQQEYNFFPPHFSPMASKIWMNKNGGWQRLSMPAQFENVKRSKRSKVLCEIRSCEEWQWDWWRRPVEEVGVGDWRRRKIDRWNIRGKKRCHLSSLSIHCISLVDWHQPVLNTAIVYNLWIYLFILKCFFWVFLLLLFFAVALLCWWPTQTLALKDQLISFN